jgi:DNA polymerase III epsilon subunit-like protein
LVDANVVIKDCDSVTAIFNSLVQHSAPISQWITGITNEFMESTPAFKEVGKRFAEFVIENCRVQLSSGTASF